MIHIFLHQTRFWKFCNYHSLTFGNSSLISKNHEIKKSCKIDSSDLSFFVKKPRHRSSGCRVFFFFSFWSGCFSLQKQVSVMSMNLSAKLDELQRGDRQLETTVALCEIRSQLQELTKSVESCQSEVSEVKRDMVAIKVRKIKFSF